MILRTLAALYSLLSDGRPPADDLTALARATGVYVDDHGYRAAAIQAEADADPTYRRLREEWDRIDAAVADWAAEVDAIADVELAELIERGER